MRFQIDNLPRSAEGASLGVAFETHLTQVTNLGGATKLHLTIDARHLAKEPADPILGIRPTFRFSVEILDDRDTGCYIEYSEAFTLDGFVYCSPDGERAAAKLEKRERLEMGRVEPLSAFIRRLARRIIQILDVQPTLPETAA